MKPTLLVLLLAGTSLFAETHVSIGIGFGTPVYYPPPPPPIVTYAPPPCPGPGYVWVPGYWHPIGTRYSWHAGYWAAAPYPGAYWVAPRYSKHRYYSGYWQRPQHIRYRNYDDRWEYRGQRWDRDGSRHYRDRDHGRGRGHKRGRR
jgi:hypothetical protein